MGHTAEASNAAAPGGAEASEDQPMPSSEASIGERGSNQTEWILFFPV